MNTPPAPQPAAKVWQARMTLGLTHLSAMAAFRRIVAGGSLPAQHPYGPQRKGIRVAFDIEGDGDHILFKSAEDIDGRRRYKFKKRPQDFQQMVADRLGWIPHVLLSPDAVYEEKAAPGNFMYVARTLPGEEFLVLIHEQVTPKGAFYFITAFDGDDWETKKRERFSRVFPAPHTPKKTGKGKNRVQKW